MINRLDEDDSAYPKCPYCGDIHICKHVALAVDLTFREVLGGYLENNLYEIIEEANNEEISDSDNSSEKFDEYINQIRVTRNFIEATFRDDSPFGLSSQCAIFYKNLILMKNM